jgi:hypothetical protein
MVSSSLVASHIHVAVTTLFLCGNCSFQCLGTLIHSGIPEEFQRHTKKLIAMEGIFKQGRKNVKKLSIGILRRVEEGRNHSEYMVLALQLDDVYRKSILEVDRKKALAGERLACVYPALVST